MNARALKRIWWRGAATALAVTAMVVATGPGPLSSAGTAAAGSAAAGEPAGSEKTGKTRLTNLAHLDHLVDEVAPPGQARHTTYRLAEDPRISVPWTYAEPEPDGSYRRIGGGSYDAATDTYTQGAFNADDISRAAVVYLRHFEQHGDEHSRQAAYQLLRGLTYLQTTSGPDAGNVVLWMQPDGTLNPSAEPREEPDPSDSGASFWLARTVWALGEGYAAFRDVDPKFARFLQDRTELAVAAIDRQVLEPHYGTYQMVDGRRLPAWLIFDGADASSEAVLGLAAYVRAGGDDGDNAAREALRKLAEGIAKMSAGDARTWPFGAALPYAKSRTIWHAWGSQMPAALAKASGALHDRSLLDTAVADTASFTPHLLIGGGPDQAWLPTAVDRSQIAYGADSRVQNLLAVAEAADAPGLRELAGTAASWYFGNNNSGAGTYDPATGRTFDGVEASGKVNRNSGAESTIHGLLSMLALDEAPEVAESARVAQLRDRQSGELLEAEDAQLDGDAEVVSPESPWTGESQWSGGKYVSLGSGASMSLKVPGSPLDRLAMPVVHRVEDKDGGKSRWTAAGRSLGTLRHGGAGAQGVSAAPGVLEMDTLPGRMPGDRDGSVLRAAAGTDQERVRVDAVLVQPMIERMVLEGGEHGRALLRSFDTERRVVPVSVPGRGTATVSTYDSSGQLVERSQVKGGQVAALVVPGGFTVIGR